MILPPSVTGKSYGYLKITINELIWWKTPACVVRRDHSCANDIMVKMQWWGSDSVVSLRPNEVASETIFTSSCHNFLGSRTVDEGVKSNVSHNSDTNVNSFVKFDIRTNIKLFEKYLKLCERLILLIVDEKCDNVFGTVIVENIYKLLSDNVTYRSNYYPILNKSNHRIGDLRILFDAKFNLQKLEITEPGNCRIFGNYPNNDDNKLKLCKKCLRENLVSKKCSIEINCCNNRSKALNNHTDVFPKGCTSENKNCRPKQKYSDSKLWCHSNNKPNAASVKRSVSSVSSLVVDKNKTLSKHGMSGRSTFSSVNMYNDLDGVLQSGERLRSSMLMSIINEAEMCDDKSSSGVMFPCSIDDDDDDCKRFLLDNGDIFVEEIKSDLNSRVSSDKIVESTEVDAHKRPLLIPRAGNSCESNVDGIALLEDGHCVRLPLPRGSVKKQKPSSMSLSSPSTMTLTSFNNFSDVRHQVLSEVNCYRLTIERLVLNEYGIKKVNCIDLNIGNINFNRKSSASRVATLQQIHNNTNRKISRLKTENEICRITKKLNVPKTPLPLPGQVYFVECLFNDGASAVKRIKSFQFSPVRFCSRKCSGNVIFFGRTLVHKIKGFVNCDTNNYHLNTIDYVFSNLLQVNDWRILWRHLNQRIPSELGKLSAIHHHDDDSTIDVSVLDVLVKRKFSLPLKTDRGGLTLGFLEIKLELGKDKILFGNSLFGINPLSNENFKVSSNVEVQTDRSVSDDIMKDHQNEEEQDSGSDDNEDFIIDATVDNSDRKRGTDFEHHYVEINQNSENFASKNIFYANSERATGPSINYNFKTRDTISETLPPFKNRIESLSLPSGKARPLSKLHSFTGNFSDDRHFEIPVKDFQDIYCNDVHKKLTLNIISVTDCPMFNKSCSQNISSYVEYNFQLDDNIKVIDGNRIFSSGVVEAGANGFLMFNYKGHHQLVCDLDANPLAANKRSLKDSVISGVTFYLWLRFYHPRPRDHMVAKAFLSSKKFYDFLLSFYATGSCEKNKYDQDSDKAKIIGLPLKKVPSSITASYFTNEEDKIIVDNNFGFLNIALNVNESTDLKGEKQASYDPPASTDNIQINCPHYYKSNDGDCIFCTVNNILSFSVVDKIGKSVCQDEQVDFCHNLSLKNHHKWLYSSSSYFSPIINKYRFFTSNYNFHDTSNVCKQINCNEEDESNGIDFQPSHGNEVVIETNKGCSCGHDVADKHAVSNDLKIDRRDERNRGKRIGNKIKGKGCVNSLKTDIVSRNPMKCCSKENHSSIINHDNAPNYNNCNLDFRTEMKLNEDFMQPISLQDNGVNCSEMIVDSTKPCNYLSVNTSLPDNNNYDMGTCVDVGDDTVMVEYYSANDIKNSHDEIAMNTNDLMSNYNSDREGDEILLPDFIDEFDDMKIGQVGENCNLGVESVIEKDIAGNAEKQFPEYETSRTDAEEQLLVITEIERALHLPKIKNRKNAKDFMDGSVCFDASNGVCDENDDVVAPNTRVRILYCIKKNGCNDDDDDDVIDTGLITPVVKSDCNPFYNSSFSMTLPTSLLHQVFGLRFAVEVVDEFGHLLKEKIGIATADLSIFRKGFPMIRGWFFLFDHMGRCKGEIKVNVTPSEDMLKTINSVCNKSSSSFCNDLVKEVITNSDPLEITQSRIDVVEVMVVTDADEKGEKATELLFQAPASNVLTEHDDEDVSAVLREKLTDLDLFMKNLEKTLHSKD